MNKSRLRIGPAAVLVCVLFLGGCGSTGSRDASKDTGVIATVNGEKITARDLKKELALRAKHDPSFRITSSTFAEQLELMINRKVLIQEAMRRRLAEAEGFVYSIRNYWEQTLIRELTKDVAKELSESTIVTEDEIAKYYAQMGWKATFQVKRTDKKDEAEDLLKKAREGAAVEWDQTLGPLTYPEVESGMLEHAFDLEAGQAGAILDHGLYYVVRVSAKEKTEVPALEQIRPKIEERLRRRKEKIAFERWLTEKKEKALIKITPQRPSPEPAHGK